MTHTNESDGGEHGTDKSDRGKQSYAKGYGFEDRVVEAYRLEA